MGGRMNSLSSIDWRSYPKTMRAEHLAELYNRKIGGVKKAAQQRSPKIPTPSVCRPWGWNRDDVRRHYERRVA
jgi:hypothetical protein